MRLLNFGLYSFFSLLSLHVIAQHPVCISGFQARDKDEDIRHQQFLDQIRAEEGNQILQSREVKHFEVVIHVVSTAYKLNVSQAQALQQLDVLNADFAGIGDNIGKLPDEFKSLVADAGLQFCLASLDPDGQPTTGITFTHTDLKHIGTQYGEGGRRVIQYDELGGKTGWDPKRYINIWIGDCENILGSSSMPDDLFPMEEIGLVIDDQHFGAFGPSGSYSEFGRGHTLTHEMGHFFGLQHIWGQGLSDDCGDSDGIDDTPNAAGPHYGCPTGDIISCGDHNMYQNFMDLTDDRCLAAFTHGQVARMQAVAQIYYSQLDISSGCGAYLTSFDQWFDGITWAIDLIDSKIIPFNQFYLPGTKKVRVFSADGKMIYETNWSDEISQLLDLQRNASGLYFVNIIYGNECKTRKVCIVK